MKKLFLLPILFLSFAQAETIQCKVVGVTDGDTITCLTDQKERIKVRLYQIDAPEAGQAYSWKAKKNLHKMVNEMIVKVEVNGTDKYDQTLGTVLTDQCWQGIMCAPRLYDLPPRNINLDMIKLGYAWYYPFDEKNPQYIKAEKEAREAGHGLWADKNQVPPWEWRKQRKSKK